MATVQKLPSGQWRSRAFHKNTFTGKVARPSFTAATKTEALRMAHEWEANEERKAIPRNLTVGECIDRYIAVKTSSSSVSTIRGYRKYQKYYFDPIKNHKVADLNDSDIQYFISKLCEEFSPKTVRNIYGLLRPALYMFTKKRFVVTLPALKSLEYNIPTDKVFKEMLRIARPKLRLAIALAGVGTLRAGEVSGLLYSDVDYELGGVHVRRDMVQDENGNWILKDIPKTITSNRFVPLPPEVMEMIGHGEPDERVYPSTPKSISRPFRRVCDRVGFVCRFHDLRHYSASILHAIGVPDQYIMERAGWKSDKVLKAVYRNTLSDQSKKFAKKANKHFSALF